MGDEVRNIPILLHLVLTLILQPGSEVHVRAYTLKVLIEIGFGLFDDRRPTFNCLDL